VQNKATVIIRFRVRRSPKFRKVAYSGEDFITEIAVKFQVVENTRTNKQTKKVRNGLLYGTGVKKDIVYVWVCMINKHDLITIDSQGCFLIFYLIRLVPLSFMKMKKMTSLQAVSKKLAMAGLNGTEYLVTSPERILGKLYCLRRSPGALP